MKLKRTHKMDHPMLQKGYIRVSEAIRASLISTTHMYRLIKEEKLSITCYGKLKYVLASSVAEYLGTDAGDLFKGNLRKKFGEEKANRLLGERLEATL